MGNPNFQQNGKMVNRAMALFRAGEIEERVLLGNSEQDLSFHRFYRISSSRSGSYFPSLHSKSTVPLSKDFKLCH